ncbi:MAG: UbiA family prenyltransferase [Deltaproteobacteria bacterium]|jgi:4-hydroxybenzoate polyprenyltransferase|nr:UbiA family prenyltransferase [Deltaproteobacteria bacterium]
MRVQDALYSLPLLIASFRLVGHWPDVRTIVLMVVALVCGRVAALVLNRWIDRELDARNPRTRDRELAAGHVSSGEALAMLAVLLGTCTGCLYALAPRLAALFPIALGIFVLYPYLKRFTWACNLFVGIQLSIIPLWIWIVFHDRLPSLPLWTYALFIVAWGTGFEVIYAMADAESDREIGVHSIPVRFGLEGARRAATAAFVIALAMIATCTLSLGATRLSVACVALLGVTFTTELWLSSRGRYIQAAHVVNGAVSTVSMGAVLLARGL